MISPEGRVTRAITASSGTRHWTTYYNLLQRGNLRAARLARANSVRLVIAALPCDVLNLVLDDTLNLRCSKKTPGVAHEHSGKTNRPKYVLAQCILISYLPQKSGGPNLPDVYWATISGKLAEIDSPRKKGLPETSN